MLSTVFRDAFGINPRERELVERLAAGADTRELAHELVTMMLGG